MRIQGQQVLLSASDLMRFMSCKHATALDLRFARGEPMLPSEDTEDAKLLQKYGDDHEAHHLSKLKAEGLAVVEFDRETDLSAAANATRSALALGPDVIFQGALLSPPWGGWSDFLIRVESPSALGAFSYEVVDTKLKRKPDPKHILQLVLYSDLLSEVQDREPAYAHVQLGSGERFSFRLSEYSAYARHARGRLEDFVAAPPPTSPDPVKMCGLCRWRDVCQTYWEETDNLSLVAGISRSQRSKLAAVGINTMTQLGKRTQRVPKLADTTLQKLVIQARLQTSRRAGGPPSFELKPLDPHRGLALLPKPDSGDVFYDIEGDPYFEGGLEYLHGLWFQKNCGTGVFQDYWAHDRAEEGEALRQLMSFFADRLKQFPNAHIYHYAAYEISALRRLTSSHGIGEAVLDQMLRENRFVDLYSVVSGALIASEPAYSLKNLEVFYMEARTDEVKTAGGSVVAYENWRLSKDPKILEEIREYNKIDCISTQKLRDWLVASVRPSQMPWRPTGGSDGANAFDCETVNDQQAAADALREKLTSVGDRHGARVANLLFDLIYFHGRERRPGWWSIFDKIGKEVEELVEDPECLGGLTAKSRTRVEGRSWERMYEFPEQETKREPGACHVEVNGLPASATLAELDRVGRTATVRFPKARFNGAPEIVSLLPNGPLNTDAIEAAIERAVESIARRDHRYPAILDFIGRSSPRFSTTRPGAIIDPLRELVPEVVAAVAELDCSLIPIQGPPGTGKTYVSSCAILELVKSGKRIAVASNSHKAIDNLLYAVLDRAAEAGETISVAKKGGDTLDERYSGRIHQTERNDDVQLSTASVVGGTAWLFSRVDFDTSFDYLFIDEAGQVSVANTAAMATCANNVVLVGDPMQLPQPIQGAHPGESGLSALEYLLAGHNTVPVDRGIFLPLSRRMHPDVCRFVSDLVYEGRLTSDEGAARQKIINIKSPLRSGAHLIEVPHWGNGQSAPEEVSAIQFELGRLLGCRFCDREGRERGVSLDDILIVAPYNLQVNALKAALPLGARVGTVDKFQGQEAPICIVSMTTSSGDEIPRSVDFLFSLNRINVAISRAQVLSLVFASPRLLEVPCNRIEDMRLVNSLCALKEYGARLLEPCRH